MANHGRGRGAPYLVRNHIFTVHGIANAEKLFRGWRRRHHNMSLASYETFVFQTENFNRLLKSLTYLSLLASDIYR